MQTKALNALIAAAIFGIGVSGGYAYAARDAHRIRQDAERAEHSIHQAKDDLFKIEHDFGGRKQEALNALDNAAIIIHQGMESIR